MKINSHNAKCKNIQWKWTMEMDNGNGKNIKKTCGK